MTLVDDDSGALAHGEALAGSVPGSALLQVPDGDEVCELLLQCADAQQAEALMQRLARAHGFDRYLYGVRLVLEGGAVFERVITDYPPAWRRHYQEHGYVRIDPTVLHCLRHVTPVIWNDEMYVSAQQKEMQTQDAPSGCARASACRCTAVAARRQC